MSEPVVELRDVTRSFAGRPEVLALRGVDLGVERGDYVSIVGPSGSGKSTMLSILGLLDRPTAGEYRFAGQRTGELDDGARTALRARGIGFVFQAFHLMPRRTVLENVMLPMLYNGTPRAVREARAREALERVRLSHRVDFAPSLLSGGERQRVAVARAVVTRPELLLADEPTGNLDQVTAGEIMRLFEELNDDGLTVMLITHDEVISRRARRRIHLRDGRIEERS